MYEREYGQNNLTNNKQADMSIMIIMIIIAHKQQIKDLQLMANGR
jgi:hypothetical protein